jgi:hypothetical protein
MSIKIESNKINGILFPSNSLILSVVDKIRVRSIASRDILFEGDYADFTNGAGVAFASVAALTTYWNLNFNVAPNTLDAQTVQNNGVGQLGDGASTVGATALGVDGIAADAKVMFTAGAHGSLVQSIMISTNDTADVDVILYALDGAVVEPLGVVSVPAGSGNAVLTPNVDGLVALMGLPVNGSSQKHIPLKAAMVLKVAVLGAMTENKILTATTTGLDYIA